MPMSISTGPATRRVRNHAVYALLAFILIAVPVLITVYSLELPQIASAQVAEEADFWEDIQPKKARVKLNESLLLNVTVGAEPGFEETTKLDFTIKVLV